MGCESCSDDIARSDWSFGSVAVLGFMRSTILGMLIVDSDLLGNQELIVGSYLIMLPF